jgi:hypothetical protein
VARSTQQSWVITILSRLPDGATECATVHNVDVLPPKLPLISDDDATGFSTSVHAQFARTMVGLGCSTTSPRPSVPSVARQACVRFIAQAAAVLKVRSITVGLAKPASISPFKGTVRGYHVLRHASRQTRFLARGLLDGRCIRPHGRIHPLREVGFHNRPLIRRDRLLHD